jgi:diaminopimelate epimerase
MRIETDAGPKSCTVHSLEGDATVTLDMGVVRFLEDRVLHVGGKAISLALADAGNPHAITFDPTLRSHVTQYGPALATHEAFARGTNVEFAEMTENGLDVVVWERGVGLTLACGTGACATVAVACAKGMVSKDEPIPVRLPGGVLHVLLRHTDGHAVLTGPARHVFQGSFVVPESVSL